MDSKYFLMLSELFEQFRRQALLLLKDAEAAGFLDDLTNCYNRNAFNVRKEQLDSLINVGVVYADVNGLKRVNDRHGHEAGDLLLKDLSRILKAYFGGNNVFRLGGDEFIVLIPNAREDILKNLVEDFRITIDSTRKTNVAIGWGFTTKDKNLDIIIKETEMDMYIDKDNFYQMHPELQR